MIKGIVIGTLLLVTLFLIIYKLLSNYYRTQRIRLVNLIENGFIKKIENIQTIGYEENGWKHNFPSSTGMYKSTIFITNGFLLISPKSAFPFLYKYELQPFIIGVNADQLKNGLRFDRIFQPEYVDRQGLNDLVMVITPKGPLGQIKLHLTFKDLGPENVKMIEQVLDGLILDQRF